MVKRRLIWSKNSIKERNEIFDYWNNRNKTDSYSKKLNLKIYSKIDLLKTFSLTGVKIEDEEARFLNLQNYSLV